MNRQKILNKIQANRIQQCITIATMHYKQRSVANIIFENEISKQFPPNSGINQDYHHFYSIRQPNVTMRKKTSPIHVCINDFHTQPPPKQNLNTNDYNQQLIKPRYQHTRFISKNQLHVYVLATVRKLNFRKDSI